MAVSTGTMNSGFSSPPTTEAHCPWGSRIERYAVYPSEQMTSPCEAPRVVDLTMASADVTDQWSVSWPVTSLCVKHRDSEGCSHAVTRKVHLDVN